MKEIQARGQRRTQPAVGVALRIRPITALRLRVRADPAVFAIGEHAGGLSLKGSDQAGDRERARALGIIQVTERVVRDNPELSGTGKSEAQSDRKNAELRPG